MRDTPDLWRAYSERLLGAAPGEPRGSVISQRGELRLDSGKWVPFTAEQWFDATRCAFCWHARAKMAPLVTAIVEDAYEDGHGRLDARLFGLFRVAHGEPGLDLDRGELIRYLGELAWNPHAIVSNPELRFTTSPSGLPRVWAHDEATHVDCVFDGAGDLVEVTTTTRVRGEHGPTPWTARYLAYGERGGVRIPIEAEVAWDLPEGRWLYWRGTIEDFHWR